MFFIDQPSVILIASGLPATGAETYAKLPNSFSLSLGESEGSSGCGGQHELDLSVDTSSRQLNPRLIAFPSVLVPTTPSA